MMVDVLPEMGPIISLPNCLKNCLLSHMTQTLMSLCENCNSSSMIHNHQKWGFIPSPFPHFVILDKELCGLLNKSFLVLKACERWCFQSCKELEDIPQIVVQTN